MKITCKSRESIGEAKHWMLILICAFIFGVLIEAYGLLIAWMLLSLGGTTLALISGTLLVGAIIGAKKKNGRKSDHKRTFGRNITP